MKPRIIFVERKPSDSVSIERVFRQIAKDISADEFDLQFQNVPNGNGISAILKNLLFFRRRSADIYHITGDIHYISLVLPRSRTVLTIHDLIFLKRKAGLRRFVLKKFYLDLPLRKSQYITVVSQAVKDEIIRHTGIQSDRITVIENPLIDGFVSGGPKPFNADRPIILHIGTAENKNLVNLIAAVTGLNCKLRIVGQLDDKIVRSLKMNNVEYENVAGLDENQILEEYRNADIVAFCSTYEGFGLPIIEAQAMRRAVITSDIAPMNAVAGRGAVLIDPHNVSSIKSGLKRLIDDSEYRNKLIEAGAENVKRFDGKALAARYAKLYRQILSKPGKK